MGKQPPQATPTPEDRTTAQRFEAKYILMEWEAQAILDYMSPYLTTDKHVTWGVPYNINSLYLDDSRLSLFWSSKVGEKNRMKLRIRTYTDKPEDPVFFEIKRRVNQIILKQRAIMTRDTIDLLFQNQDVPHENFLKNTEQERFNFYQFRDIMEQMDAGPRCMVQYTREAYMSALDEPIRITFDRNLAGMIAKEYRPDLWTYDARYTDVDVAPVILEIKFTNTFPFWVKRAIYRFNLLRGEFAKYVTCVDILKNEGQLADWTSNFNEDPLWSSTL